MKKYITILLLLGAVKHSTAQVTVYSDCNYNIGIDGKSLYLGEGGLSNLSKISNGVFNNMISSIKVQPGYMVYLYDGYNFMGDIRQFDTDVSCLVDYGFNDKTSSIKIVKKQSAPQANLTPEQIHAGQAFTTLYDENAYVRANAGRISGNIQTSTGNSNTNFGGGYFCDAKLNGAFYYNSLKQGADNRTAIWGKVMDKWSSHNREHGDMGWPSQSVTPTPKKTGEFAHFQKGSIYYSPNTGSHIVWGTVRNKWAKLGWENSLLGFPKTDEVDITEPVTMTTIKKIGVYQDFEGGRIYYQWDGASEAFEMHGDILAKYLFFGGPTHLGFPTSDEIDIPGGKMNSFPSLKLVWKNGIGTNWVNNSIYNVWLNKGGPGGKLGFPVSGPGYSGNIETQKFEGGIIMGNDVYYKDVPEFKKIEGTFKLMPPSQLQMVKSN